MKTDHDRHVALLLAAARETVEARGRIDHNRNAGRSVTAFSRHLPDRPFPLLAIAGRLSGTRFARTTLVDAGSRSAKGAARIALPFRLQGNDAAKWTGGDMRGKVLR